MTLRTNGKRPDYKQLHATGELIQVYSWKGREQEFHRVSGEVGRLALGTPQDDEVIKQDQIQNMAEGKTKEIIGEQTVMQDAEIQRMDQNDVIITQLIGHTDALADDIEDFMEENPVEEIATSVEDLDSTVNKIEELRSKYRSQHKELQMYFAESYEEKFRSKCAHTLTQIKYYIKDAKCIRRKLRVGEELDKNKLTLAREKKLEFLVGEVHRTIASLGLIFGVDVSDGLDEDIINWRKELHEHLKVMQSIPKSIQEIIDLGEEETELNTIKSRYENLITSTSAYIVALEGEVKIRDIEKQIGFNKSSLNIKLGKFKGYDSSIDIYTFQDHFEKLHGKGTPKSLLPDMLKNNYLEGPALLLAKDVVNIHDIWKRLKDAFGDCRIMLSKKLAEFNTMEHVWKQKDPSKEMESLNKIINLMRDLLQLSKRHNIENKLYYGDGIDCVYNLMGGNRLSRWLMLTDVEEGEEQWLQLIQFLEKELKVCQQKAIIMEKNRKSTHQSQKAPFAVRTSNPSYYTGESKHADARSSRQHNDRLNLTCSFCDELGHVQTNGPGGIKLVQYFACKKFTQMSPQQRFQTLRAKGLCFQCLFPGAESNKGKHNEGYCQREFACKHLSHEKFPSRKHVLVCEEHKDTKENKELLQYYKSRCIFKQNQVELPSYAKEIQLSHYVMTSIKGTSNQKNKLYWKGKDGKDEHTTTKADTQVIQRNFPMDVPIGDCWGDKPRYTSEEFSTNREENGIYVLQTIKIDDDQYSIFYDTGCGRFCSKYNSIQRLGSRAKQQCIGPIPVGGVGGISTEARHGTYSVKLPLADGNEAVLTGVCLDQITEAFPIYPLAGEVEEDIRRGYLENGGNLHHLPKLPLSVGGDTDFMIGTTYMRYHPEEIFRLPSGLVIYKSLFRNVDGSLGVIGGPHKIFSEIEKLHHVCSSLFVAAHRQMFKDGYLVNPDISLLGYKDDGDRNDIELSNSKMNVLGESNGVDSPHIQRVQHRNHFNPRFLKKFEDAEMAGSEINYRCVKCRSCKDCKNYEHAEMLSIKEEVEHEIIKKSVIIDVNNRVAIADLPLIGDPVVKLVPNKHKALKVYYQQLKRAWKSPKDVRALLQSEQTLQDLGFVEWVENLPKDIQKMLKDNPIQNYIPWRVVWKESSTTTPCRIVFDASQPTDSGYSLNDIVPKGINMMNKMVEIFIRWRTYPWAFHCDVQKMYNAIQLKDSFWCLQRYLFQRDLDPSIPPQEKVIKTCIYGVKSSGNQAQCGLRQTAELLKDEYPEINDIVSKDMYVDDCMSGDLTKERSRRRQDELQLVLGGGGFTLKGFTVTGKDPEASLSNDGVSICVAGLNWFPREDCISLDIKNLNFARKFRGRKTGVIHQIPDKLTKRDCASKLGEIFDLTGLVTPLIAGMKLDLHELNVKKLNWDDVLPANLQSIWESHFQMMSEMKNLRYQRAIIPEDAVDLNLTTLDFGDASQSLACVAIYARFKRKNAGFSCQLIFSKSRLIPDHMSQPRAELFAALINTHAGEVVRRALCKYHQQALKFTDSQIVIYWICNNQILKQWVRNRIIEIQRFTDKSSWRYVKSGDMVADIGTRRCSSIDMVKSNSVWVNGLKWMKEDESKFPMLSAKEISLNNQETQSMKHEVQVNVFKPTFTNKTYYGKNTKALNESILMRYKFSDYIIDPNRHRFKVVIRIMAFVMKFINKLRQRVGQRRSHTAVSGHNAIHIQRASKSEIFSIKDIQVSEEDLLEARTYFFKKATLEVKNFLNYSQYKDTSEEVDGVLRYTGRILPTDEVSIIGRATQVMKDLSSTTFYLPLVDKHSPVAYSIANDIHWYHPTARHCGVETVWRYVLKEVYIIEGRSLITKIRKTCERCRYLNKKNIEVSMGPVSPYNLTIAPAFFITQVDLAGPVSAHCHHHRRNTIKVWMIVFCCATTSTTCIKVMEDYSTTSFVQAFMRFSSEVGYPKMLLCDEGSQLIKGCESMRLSFRDIKHRLYQDNVVEFNTCPVDGHNVNGKVERKIREIKKSIAKSLMNNRLSIMQWETLAATISNNLNNMPLALGNTKSNLEGLDLLTPNRLRLGRNNERSPIGSITLQYYDKTIEENEAIFNVWFEMWLTCHVPKLLDQPKWFKSEKDLKPGDVVLFLKQNPIFCANYQYGIIESVKPSRDKRIRKVKVRYRNFNENTDRTTHRSVRSLVVIRRADESNVMEELGEISRFIENERQVNQE